MAAAGRRHLSSVSRARSRARETVESPCGSSGEPEPMRRGKAGLVVTNAILHVFCVERSQSTFCGLYDFVSGL